MTKLQVLNPTDGSRVPFLRGILTRSLQDAGLSFDDAYGLATGLRDELAPDGEITADRLQEIVITRLESYGAEVLQRYRSRHASSPVVLVRLEDGQMTPFSRGRHRMDLESCGLTAEQAMTVVERIARLVGAREEIEVRELRYLTFDVLTENVGPELAGRYVVWEDFQQSDRPLLLFIGGTAGSGKSTIANQVAHRLEIVRTQSTDMLREVMRMMIPERLLPVLHSSSFKAGAALAGHEGPAGDAEAQLVNGYLTQTGLLSVASEAVIQRALLERVSLIVEGVHVHGSLLEHIPKGSDAIVVPMLLAVLKRAQLRRRIQGRSAQVPTRRTRRYLDHFDEIWRLQTYLLDEADRTGIHIISNEDKDRTVQRVMATIARALSESFRSSPEQVFGPRRRS